MPARHPRMRPHLVFAGGKGAILDYSGMSMAGSAGGEFYAPEPEELIALPEGSEL